MLADVIRKKRKNMGLSQEEFASYLNVSRISVAKWENAKCIPKPTILIGMSQKLNCTIDELLRG